MKATLASKAVSFFPRQRKIQFYFSKVYCNPIFKAPLLQLITYILMIDYQFDEEKAETKTFEIFATLSFINIAYFICFY